MSVHNYDNLLQTATETRTFIENSNQSSAMSKINDIISTLTELIKAGVEVQDTLYNFTSVSPAHSGVK